MTDRSGLARVILQAGTIWSIDKFLKLGEKETALKSKSQTDSPTLFSIMILACSNKIMHKAACPVGRIMIAESFLKQTHSPVDDCV